MTPKADVIMIQEHKLRGKAIESLGNSLMPGYASWILEAAPGEKSWINPNAAGKGGVGILLSSKYSRLVVEHIVLYEDIVVWIKVEGVEGCAPESKRSGDWLSMELLETHGHSSSGMRYACCSYGRRVTDSSELSTTTCPFGKRRATACTTEIL